jgi:hypothetical protein
VERARDVFLQTEDVCAALAYAAEMTRERIIPIPVETGSL